MPAKFLNEHCACKTFDSEVLKTKLKSDELLKGLYQDIVETRPNLFSATTVFLSSQEMESIKQTIEAIERTLLHAEFKTSALNRAPVWAQIDKGTSGVCMGYDFHLGPDGPRLIEVNTNAGGALLNLELALAQVQCCQGMDVFFQYQEDLSTMDKVFFEMFKQEWTAQRGNEPLGLIAIVDERPQEQYLYPEFQLFQRLFAKFGAKAVIADPQELSFHDHKLWYKDQMVGMVYNRLTDFYLETETNNPIKNAYLEDAIVLTPSPYHHALYANKLNLVSLSSEADLQEMKIDDETSKVLRKGIPETQEVTTAKAALLWEQRRSLFFKPVSGYGSKATYRGEKITKRVWEEILKAPYVAQALIPPGKRIIQDGKDRTDLKFDIRAYTYQGKIQILAARLYEGQTTNFRTSGGGFAPVFVMNKEIG